MDEDYSRAVDAKLAYANATLNEIKWALYLIAVALVALLVVLLL